MYCESFTARNQKGNLCMFMSNFEIWFVGTKILEKIDNFCKRKLNIELFLYNIHGLKKLFMVQKIN